MREALAFFLTFSGLWAQAASLRKDYILVTEERTWDEAQAHCREAFSDLASVHNASEYSKLQMVLQGHGSRDERAWIGLYNNDSQLWWSLRGEAYTNNFSRWADDSDEDSDESWEGCFLISHGGSWMDSPCGREYPAVCYNERGPAHYTFVGSQMTWNQAQLYCRAHHTDLASIKTLSENWAVTAQIPNSVRWAWFGLHANTLSPWARWSDNTFSRFTKWQTGEPSIISSTRICVSVNIRTGDYLDTYCNNRRFFVCQHVYQVYRQRLRLRLQSEADLRDLSLQEQALQQLQEVLEDGGMSQFRLRWVKMEKESDGHREPQEKQKGSHV